MQVHFHMQTQLHSWTYYSKATVTPTYHLLLLLRRGCCKHGCCQRLLPLHMHSGFSHLDRENKQTHNTEKSSNQKRWKQCTSYLACPNCAGPQTQLDISPLQAAPADSGIACLYPDAGCQESQKQAIVAPVTPAAPGKVAHTINRAVGLARLSSHVIPEQDWADARCGGRARAQRSQSRYLRGHHGWHVPHRLDIPDG